ncbi:glyoxalase [Luteitalea sp. TBR-22]|uniref:VOC family protein n=1 Tax=Luteitalea sp. TBR-22 TaxID=2802971 RepID=UPI001AF1F4C5|nr:VOC family protein [Luteitalea sp. TBR-22]BCS31548.1 glyoxalase [Luteitalea sp. TBR-22]
MRLVSTVIYVDDVVRTIGFYEAAFGCGVKFLDADVRMPGRIDGQVYQFAELDVAGATLQFGTHALGALLMPGFERPSGGGPSGVEIAFYTDDVPGAFARAVAAGATPLRAPETMPWGQEVAYVRSLEGTFIGLCAPIGEPADPS